MTMHVNEIITNQIIGQLQNGIIPWFKPWFSADVTGNINTKWNYNAINRMLVSHAGKYMTYKYLTEKNIEIIRPDDWEKRYPDKDFDKISTNAKFRMLSDIICGKFREVEQVTDESGNPVIKDGKPVTRERWAYKYWKVLWEGYTSANTLKLREKPVARLDSCDALIKHYTDREGIEIFEELGSEAFYRPADDTVHLPKITQFKNTELFYGTAFHELTHSTGVSKRLNRNMSGGFGSKNYAREELVAELGSAFLTQKFGIRTKDVEHDNTAYINNWIKALQNDPDLILKASAMADKAMAFITDGFVEPEQKEEPKEEPKEPKEPKELKPGLIEKAELPLHMNNEDGKPYLKTVKGYTFRYGDDTFFANKREEDNIWQVSCIKTGMYIYGGYKTRKEAMAQIKRYYERYKKCFETEKCKFLLKQYEELKKQEG